MSSRSERMTKFRLKMDMSQFYDDERNLVYVLVDPKWEQVLCLQEHVQRVFDVPVVHFLTEDGVYIPPRESIDIIKTNDVLSAIVPQKIRKKKKTKNIGYGDEAEESLEGDQRKCNDDGLTSSTPNDMPRKKQRIAVNLKKLKNIIEGDNSEAQKEQTMLNMYTTRSQKARYTISSNDSSVKETQEVSVLSAEETEETVKTRKRKRSRRKNKPSALKDKKEAKSPRLSSVPVPISSSTLRSSNAMRTPDHSRKHIYYDESATLVEPDSADRKQRVIYQCHLTMEGALEPREIEAEVIEQGALPPKKPKILIQENLVLVSGRNDTSGSDEQNETSVIEVDDTVIRPDPEESSTDYDKEPYPTISVGEILPLSEPLLDLPHIGEIILFKMYRVSDGSLPDVTEYICGRCEELDPNLRTMTLLVLDGLDQTADIPRISMGDGDRIVPNENTNCIMVFIDELLDKKVFRMS